MDRDQEMYVFLNMCNLCRYARFSQAQSHIVYIYIYIYIYILFIYLYLYHGAWADQRLATVLQIGCYPVYKWFVTQL